MTRAKKIITLSALAIACFATMTVFTEYWMRFTAVFVFAAVARAVWTAPGP